MNNLVGRKIVNVRQLTKWEMDDEGWDEQYAAEVVALVLDDGTLVYASRDEEGNGSGELFTREKDGKTGMLFIQHKKG
jgi:hypothetical protein